MLKFGVLEVTALYGNIMVAIDNSEWSNYAVCIALDLAKRTKAKVTGAHVYAAQLHGTRFRQLEPGLPERYQSEELLQRQRNIHGDLIGRGLGIISDAYLDVFTDQCRQADVTAERKALEGRNYERLVSDARESGYDLVVIGAHGLGRISRAVIGSVCERVVRLVDCDVLVVRDDRALGTGSLLVAMDGSAHSFAALYKGLALSQIYGNSVKAVAAYDPFFHRVAFRSVTGVLSDEASKLFRFKEQEKLHDEIIDEGLMKTYRSHLLRAQKIAAETGIQLEIDVLEGKPFEAITTHVEQMRPSALLVGRTGMHHGAGVMLGSTTENLLRFADCNVLVVNCGREEATATSDTEESAAEIAMPWAIEAEERLERVPSFARNIARRGIEGYAREHGHIVITLDVYEAARQRFGM